MWPFGPRKLRGADIPHNKVTADQQTTCMSLPSTIVLPMQQHIGAKCQPQVAKGDHVDVGTLVGHAEARTSADIFSSVSGTVVEIRNIFYSNGDTDVAVVIEPDGAQTLDGSIGVPDISDYQSLIAAMKRSGIVGLGGAGFPTDLKLDVDFAHIDRWLVNAAECEPYISSDYREMMEHADTIMHGLTTCLDLSGVPQASICIEEDKTEAISFMKKQAASDPRVEIAVLPERYPQGAGHVLVHNVTGRSIPRGGHVTDAGVVLFNVTTMSMIGKFLQDGVPLTKRRITVMGDAVAHPQNVEVLVGTPIREVVEHCGLAKEVRKIIVGGPMMGYSQVDWDYPIVRQNNGLLVFSEMGMEKPRTTACIRCGACISSCPMRLYPREIQNSYRRGDAEALDKLAADLCMKCGTCSYVCPAKQPLTQATRLACDQVKAARKAARRAAQKKGA
ncbi:MAG: electron transport complex subunit RsxC [Eggerthellaceae bacterium]|nr:electron transport complex subunit RsxC [Eggerthellaceae bacterium]